MEDSKMVEKKDTKSVHRIIPCPDYDVTGVECWLSYMAEQGVPQRFELIGAGWGHGVGLCQIGAAMMGEEGYLYDAILLHYYQGAEIKKLYK